MTRLRLKRKIKKLWFHLLGLLTISAILVIAYFNNRLIETAITMLLFFIYRRLFVKQYHASSLYLCSLVSIIVFIVVIHLQVDLTISILYSVVLTFIITLISYYVRDYFDNRLIVNKYKKLELKELSNYSYDELVKILPNIKETTLKIVYGYLHKDRNMYAKMYASINGISEPLLYKYVKQVKDAYNEIKDLSN